MGRRVVAALNRAAEVLKREGPMPWYTLAVRIGYSPEYFRRALMPTLLDMYECVQRDGHLLRWVCDDGSGRVEQAEREADELFERLEQARMS